MSLSLCAIYKKMYYKKLATTIMKTGKNSAKSAETMSSLSLKPLTREVILLWAQGQETAVEPGRANVQFEGHQTAEFSYLRKCLSFAIFRHLSDWIGPSILWRGIALLTNTDLNINLIPNHTHRNTQINV